ncbi:MAG: hypothetical protein ABI466_03135, partial [Chloroflexota bacterium]
MGLKKTLAVFGGLSASPAPLTVKGVTDTTDSDQRRTALAVLGVALIAAAVCSPITRRRSADPL